MFFSSWVSLRTGQNSLVAQGLGCQALTAEGLGSVPGRGTKIPQAVQPHGKEHTPHSPSTLSPLSKLPRNLLKFKTVVFIFSSYLLYTQHSLGPTLKLILIHLQRCEFSVSTIEEQTVRISLVVQWLGLCTCTARGTGSIPGWGTEILHAMQLSQQTF